MKSPTQTRQRTCRLFAAAMGWAALSTGCLSWLPFQNRPDVVFPHLDSAQQQFFYAVDYEQATLVPQGKKGRERLRRIIACYQSVIDHFPNDETWTPLAHCAIGNCYTKMEAYRRAIRVYKRAMEDHPNYPFVHAQAAWKIGRAYEQLGEREKAMEYYKSCVDTFRHSKNDQILAYVSLCRQQYLRPSVPPRDK